MKLEEKVLDAISEAGGLANLGNQDQFVRNVISLVRNEENPRDSLRIALDRYLNESRIHYFDGEEVERLFVGMLAFVWVNIWGEPYEPIYMDPVEETLKKWWQFWK